MTHWSIRKTGCRMAQVARIGQATGLGDNFSAVVDYALSMTISQLPQQEAQEMYGRLVDVVVVDNIEDAAGIIRDADEGHPFDDNGGDPDGNAWIVEPLDLGSALRPIVNGGIGRVVLGTRIEGYRGTDEVRAWMDARFREWCGFSSRDVAYGIR